MALIDQKTADFLRAKFSAELVRPVRVELFRGSENAETVQFSLDLLTELAELSPLIRFEVQELSGAPSELGLKASPTLLVGRELGYRLEYWGAPLGMEAEGFIDTLILASRGATTGLSDASRALLELLPADRTVRAYSFVTPTCPHCPRSVMQNHMLALAAPGRVRSICVEASENLELAQSFSVSSVPQQLFDEDRSTSTVGVQPERRYVHSLLTHAGVDVDAIRATEQEAMQAMTKLPETPSKPVQVTEQNFETMLQQYPRLVVDCWAEWCGPCRMLGPVIEQLADEMQGDVVFGKLDTEENAEISAKYQIHSIPTMLVFAQGKLVDRLVGFKPKPALKQDIERVLASAPATATA